MKRIRARIFLISLFFLAAFGAFAQTPAKSQSVTIKLVAVVPTILEMSLDFSAGSTARVTGYVPATDGRIPEAVPNGTNFEIREGAAINLGNLNVVSNLKGHYSISVVSSNGGKLRSANGSTQDGIPYNLVVGDTVTASRNGTFNFVESGKTSWSGSPLNVSIALANVPSSASTGTYSDELFFSISAN